MAILDATGLEIPRLEDIRQDIVDDIKAEPALGATVQTGSGSVLGQLIDVFADREASIWEALEAVYAMFRSQTADGVHLDNLTGLAGIYREAATKSTGYITPGGTPSTVIPLGSQVRVPNGAIYETTAAGTIGGDDIPIEALESGPIATLAAEITEIVTAVAGWTSVTNADDVSPGRNVETDAELRERWLSSLVARGSATDAAIAARVLGLTYVDSARVISNRTDSEAINGQPPHSGNLVIWPDTLTTAQEDEILQLLWGVWPAGILSWGFDVIGYVVDQNGNLNQMAFDYATQVTIYIEVQKESIDTSIYPVDGDQQIKDLLVAYGATLAPGDDVNPVPLIGAIAGIPGLRDLTILVDRVDPPTVEARVEILDTEIAVILEANIDVTGP